MTRQQIPHEYFKSQHFSHKIGTSKDSKTSPSKHRRIPHDSHLKIEERFQKFKRSQQLERHVPDGQDVEKRASKMVFVGHQISK